MKIFFTLTIALLIIFQSIGFAAVKTFSASGEYLMSDYDTPEIAEEIALDFAKQNAAEQAGIYLESYSRTKDFEIEETEIKTVASSKVEVLTKNITRQPQNNGRVLLRADIKATVDTSELDNFIKQTSEQRQAAIQRYKELQAMNEKIKQDIAALQKKLSAIKDDVKDDDLIVEQERINREFLSNQKLDDFEKKLGANKEFKYDMSLIDEAIKINPKNLRAYSDQAFYTPPFLILTLAPINKALVIAPNESRFYVMRGAHYSGTGTSKRLNDKNADVKQDFDKALENYNKAVELDPNNALTYVNRGLFYKTIKDYDKALADYNKAVELDPKNLLARKNRAELHEELKNNSAAVGDYEKFIEVTDTKNLDGYGYIDLGKKYEKLKDYIHAIESYTKAIEMKPQVNFTDHRAFAYADRANVYVKLGEYDKAIADCDKAIELNRNKTNDLKKYVVTLSTKKTKNTAKALKKHTKEISDDPENQDAYYNRGTILSISGNDEAALEDFNTLIKLNPNYGNGKAYFRRGIAYEYLGKFKEALADFDKALELNPNSENAKKHRQRLTNPDLYKEIETLSEQARNFRNNKDYSSAVNAYSKILELDPNDQNALFQRGMCYNDMEQYEKAVADYDKLIEFNLNYDKAMYYNRGQAHRNLKNYAEAIADYTKYLEHDPNEQDALFNRGMCYNNTKQYQKALADYNKLLELNPNYDKAAYYNRGRTHRNLKNYAEAIADYTKYLEHDPNDQNALFNRGMCYNNTKQYEKALADYNKLLELNPNYAAAYNNRGVAYDNLGDLKKALADFDKALELNPTDNLYKKNRQRVLDKLKK